MGNYTGVCRDNISGNYVGTSIASGSQLLRFRLEPVKYNSLGVHTHTNNNTVMSGDSCLIIICNFACV